MSGEFEVITKNGDKSYFDADGQPMQCQCETPKPVVFSNMSMVHKCQCGGLVSEFEIVRREGIQRMPSHQAPTIRPNGQNEVW